MSDEKINDADEPEEVKLRLELMDFAVGLIAALYVKGQRVLNDRDTRRLHATFLVAFKEFKKEAGNHNIRFSINTHRVHGTSPDVFSIFSIWRGPWASQDSGGNIWRFRLDDESAERIFVRQPGMREVYLKTADTFLEHYRP